MNCLGIYKVRVWRLLSAAEKSAEVSMIIPNLVASASAID